LNGLEMKEKRSLIVLIMMVFLSSGGCALFKGSRPEPAFWDENSRESLMSRTETFVFKDEFRGILDNLMQNYWDPSGNWNGDIQGDATLFASMLLFALSRDTHDTAMEEMAQQTASYEASLVRRFFYYPVVHMDLVMGFPALAQPYLFTGDDAYRFLFTTGVRSGNIMISLMPGVFVSFVHDRATLYASASYMCFLAHEMSETEFQKNSFKKKGIAWIERANRDCWNEEAGLYEHFRILDWPQTTMMMALTAAYRATSDAQYLDQCLLVLDSMEALCRDSSRGGYRGHPDLSRKGLSGNNNMVWVLLDLYEITGEKMYLERARSALEWVLSEDLYDEKEHIIYHHWDDDGGRADYFCTGCNFHTLCNIYRLNTIHPPQ